MEWIRCSDRLPEIGQKVIIPVQYQRDGNALIRQFVSGAIYKELSPGNCIFFHPSEGYGWNDVLYWIPLPELPIKNSP